MVTISIIPIYEVIRSDLLIPKRWRSLNSLKASSSQPGKGHKELPGTALVPTQHPLKRSDVTQLSPDSTCGGLLDMYRLL